MFELLSQDATAYPVCRCCDPNGFAGALKSNNLGKARELASECEEGGMKGGWKRGPGIRYRAGVVAAVFFEKLKDPKRVEQIFAYLKENFPDRLAETSLHLARFHTNQKQYTVALGDCKNGIPYSNSTFHWVDDVDGPGDDPEKLDGPDIEMQSQLISQEAFIANELENYTDAEKYAKQACAVDRFNVSAYDELLYALSGNKDPSAVILADDLIFVGGPSANNLVRKARALCAVGNYTDAKKWCQKSLELDPNNDMAQKLMIKIEGYIESGAK